MNKLILFYCSFLFIPFLLNSQDYQAKTLTAENGLPSDQIYCAKEDSKGYIWIGTKNGVARWDSKNFDYFTIKDGLPNNEVTSIQEDSEGRIWFSSFNKSISYYYKSKFFNPKTDTRLINIKLNNDFVFRKVDTSLYFYHEDNTVKKINSRTLEVTNSDLPKGHLDILKIENKQLSFDYSTSYKDLALFFKAYGNKRILNELFSHINFGLKIPNTSHFEMDSLIQNNLDSIFDPSFRIKDLLSKKQFILSKQKGKLFYQTNCFSLIFNSPNISKTIEDDILKLFLIKNKIHFLTKDKVIFSNSPLTKIKILNYQNVLYNIDREGSRQFIAETSNLFEVSNKFKNRATEYGLDNIKYVSYHTRSNSIFTGTGHGLFQCVNNKTKKLNTKRVYSVKLNSKNILWFSTTDNLYYSPQFDTIITKEKELVLNPNFKVFVNEIREDKSGYMIFATNNGVYFYHPETKLKYWLNDANFLSSNECNRVEIDSKDNILWVSTFNGLNHIQYSSVDGKLKFRLINRFFKDDGLYANEINDFLIQGDSVWVATPKGLNLYTIKTIDQIQ